ncbi:hypothetical protein F5883DRAFT_136378 [Diaporthe sp. PMI_573]|nr:hypothetical protein F5883DRAFT_136378 [Diaporthaceae sp. PMI_573]
MPPRRLHIYYTQDEIPSISLPMVLSIIPHAPPKLNVALPKALLLSSSRLKDERWRLVFFVPSSILCLLHTGACAHTAQRSTPATPRPSSDASHRPPTATLRTPTRTLRSVVVVAHSILNPTSRGLSSKGKVALLATCLACRAYVRTVTCAVSHPIPYIHTPLLQHTHTHTHILALQCRCCYATMAGCRIEFPFITLHLWFICGNIHLLGCQLYSGEPSRLEAITPCRSSDRTKPPSSGSDQSHMCSHLFHQPRKFITLHDAKRPMLPHNSRQSGIFLHRGIEAPTPCGCIDCTEVPGQWFSRKLMLCRITLCVSCSDRNSCVDVEPSLCHSRPML